VVLDEVTVGVSMTGRTENRPSRLPEPPENSHFIAADTRGEITATPHFAARPSNG
jgi:hypothetical protein